MRIFKVSDGFFSEGDHKLSGVLERGEEIAFELAVFCANGLVVV